MVITCLIVEQNYSLGLYKIYIQLINDQTVAGNIATASPISDLNPIWMVSGAKVMLESAERKKVNKIK